MMPFTKHCKSKQLHDRWKCDASAKLFHRSKILSSVVNKLLELIEAQYDDNALFCDDCIKKVCLEFPNLTQDNKRTVDPEDRSDTSELSKMSRLGYGIIDVEKEARAAEEKDDVQQEPGIPNEFMDYPGHIYTNSYTIQTHLCMF